MKDTVLRPLQKTLVVGLGGTGKRVLLQLKRRLADSGYKDSTEQPDLKLICLDFDPAEERTIARTNGQRDIRLAPDESCWLDGNLINNRLRNLAQDHNQAYYRDWYPDSEGAVIQMGAYRAGAAQWRPLGRIGYYECAERIQVVLRRSLNRLLNVDPNQPPREGSRGVAVYIVCSLAGGTGSGIFLDVAYFLRTMPVDIKQMGMLLLPGIYAEYDISGRLFANTYACLKELSVFANQSEPFTARYPNGRRVSVPKQGESPFDQLFLYDNVLQRDELTTSPEVMAAVMAETIFFDLAATSVTEANISATTNTTKEAGSQDDSRLARQSVFSMVGSLTLLLPSRQDLLSLIAQHYLTEVLFKSLEGARQDLKRQSLTRAGQEGQEEAAGFGPLGKFVRKTLEDTVKACRLWDGTYNERAAQEMAKALLGLRHSQSEVLGMLDQWLGELVTPRADGEFTVAPLRLPDMALGGAGPLQNALAKLKTELESRVDAIMAEQGEEGQARSEQVYIYLRGQAQALRQEVQERQDELKRSIEAADGDFAALKQDLQALFKANPPAEGELDSLSVQHWARRFLRLVEAYYGRFACQVRVHVLLAQAMEQVCEERLMDREVFGDLLEALPRLHEQALANRQALLERLARAKTPGVWSAVNKGFLDRLGQAVSGLLPTQGAVLGFMVYLTKVTGGPKTSAGLSPKRLAELALEHAMEKAAQLLVSQAGEALLEPLAYLDPSLRAQALDTARHDFMVRDALLNANENRRAYVSLPSYSKLTRPSGRLFEEIKGLVSNSLEASSIDVRAYSMNDLPPDEPGRLLVRHLSLNHPATNLRNIGEYYYAYARFGANRRLFHLDYNFFKFPEVIDENLSLKYVTCGNPGCHEDITDLSRRTIICPHCQRPIRSRCGNDGCPEDELHKRPNWTLDNPDKYCPICHKPARTYWWRCKRHNVDLRTESSYCNHCLDEFRKGTITFDQVSPRDEVKRHLDCPGCRHDCRDIPFQVEFLDVYYEVPDHLTAEAWEIYSQPTRNGYCPKCGAQLLPFCPYHEGEGRAHFVHRFQAEAACQQGPSGQVRLPSGRGSFFCTSDQEHAQKNIQECSFCHLPLREDATYCPRCKGKRLPLPSTMPDKPRKDEGQTEADIFDKLLAAYLQAQTEAASLSREEQERQGTKLEPRHLRLAIWLAQNHCHGKEIEPAELLDVAKTVLGHLTKDNWLWFGLGKDDWEKLKSGQPKDKAGQGCGEEPPEGVSQEAAILFGHGRREEDHDPA